MNGELPGKHELWGYVFHSIPFPPLVTFVRFRKKHHCG